MSLSDEQVQAEMRKMISFIKQEALEKAKEIHTLSEEDFQVEKAKIVREECETIDRNYEGKLKRVSMAQKIAKSNVMNRSRLDLLNSRQEVIDGIFSKVEKKLEGIEQKKDAYVKFLCDLIVQSMEMLSEPVGIIYARQRDLDLVSLAISKAIESLKEQETFKSVEIDIDHDEYLDDSCLGGIKVVGLGGKIKIDNTMKARLELIKKEALPQIRHMLFGANPNRKHLN
ncbi:V-type ATPase V1 subunit E [Schizosaccharomyces cryophilus OY26]|uniref:V-type ATPase V1 subunit E n=1 Tax=Schizosaccharomyces cryophilus (strain OY26 / ATCC MYA-4695 / CBS 11777 / NBRC 106824 / NRRL Y48691) TaxID=653667 RepID=S9VVM4_SCHCR|nr:V-type ATPase V1 subunit E [Schizosaccharomyces cryophilus OY26]EPY50170.1 V-type ATPase V1 subunit E [Schizosaccharomyces cryophilus OY26]